MRRLISIAAAFLLLGSASAWAQGSYPTKPVRIVFPSAAGSSGDVRTRLLAEKLSQRLGQQFVVENKPGGSTTLGNMAVRDAKPDGYTLLATFTPAFPVGPLLYREVRYDPLTSFTPIAIFSQGSPFLVVHPSVPATTLKEFIALAKASPGKLSLAHAGPGSANHLPAELFRQRAGIELLYVPYKSEIHALPDLLSGRVSAMFAYTAVAVPQVKGGTLRALAVAGSQRNSALPDIPTIAESGFPGYEFHGTMLLLGPAGLPAPIVATLSREVKAIMEDPSVQASYATTGADPLFGTPEQTRALISREVEVNVSLVKQLGLVPE